MARRVTSEERRADIDNSDEDQMSSSSKSQPGEDNKQKQKQKQTIAANPRQKGAGVAGKGRREAPSSRRRATAIKDSKYGMPSIALLVGLVGFVAYYGYLGYLETRIYTPLNQEKILNEEFASDRFWGTYRPGFYFGMRHRSPKSLTVGLMWILPSQLKRDSPGLRHQCQQADNLARYGWIEHDGVNFGVQEIKDVQMSLATSFVKQQGGHHGGDWTARIDAQPETASNTSSDNDNKDEIVLIFYVSLEPDMEGSLSLNSETPDSSISGFTTALDHFKIRFLSNTTPLKSTTLVTKISSLNDISHVALQNMVTKNKKGKWLYHFGEGRQQPPNPNMIMYQVHAKGPFTLDIVYESSSYLDRSFTLSGDLYSKRLQELRINFQEKFEKTFHLKAKGFNESSIAFAQAALSNMLGGIGYFFGSSRVQSIHNNMPALYWPAALYTAVPSRSFFPRGFLWDEGFHLLLINKWNPEISVDILSHWLDLMNVEGWIPREQILGEEAQVRVPEEFIVQKNDNANPPTLILALADLLARRKDWLYRNHKETLYRIWPRVVTWYQWLNKTQIGEKPFTYRWRGRNATTIRELNPKTLASGLDDYPRASHPTDEERHLDLRCWMAAISKLMQDLAEVLGYENMKYRATFQTLTNLDLLNKQHWSSELEAYADFGLHSEKVGLKYLPLTEAELKWQQQTRQQIQREKVRVTSVEPKYGFVNMFGYVNLFPVILQLLPHDSPELLSTLEKLKNPNYLWTPYGLRSLAANAQLYNARNTEHDPPYWRGAVWININFLALKSLKYYAGGGGVSSKVANEIYVKLRNNVMFNIMRQYQRTGYLWEHYNDKTGEGEGCRPFTGWSALVVLIMAEEY